MRGFSTLEFGFECARNVPSLQMEQRYLRYSIFFLVGTLPTAALSTMTYMPTYPSYACIRNTDQTRAPLSSASKCGFILQCYLLVECSME